MRRLTLIVAVLAAGSGLALLAGAAGGTTAASNRAAARAAAARILGQVPLPPGATEVSTDPSSSTWLSSPVSGAPATPDLVDFHRFWRVPGDPDAVFRWLEAHPPPGATVSLTGTGGDRGKTVTWSVGFRYPAAPGRISEEGLGVAVTAADGGGTAMRADAFAIWLIPRPAAEVVPRGTRAVAVFVDHFDGHATPVRTVSAPWKVRRLIAFIDSRQRAQPGATACPMIGTTTPLLDLRFLPAIGGSPLARAVEDGCGGLSFSIRGHRWPALAESGNLAALLRKLGALPASVDSSP